MAHQMAHQLQQQHQNQQNQQNYQSIQGQQRQLSPGTITAVVAGEFTTPRTPRQSPQGLVNSRSAAKQPALRGKEQAMGLLRSGKAYSPCRKGNEPEKRRLSLSAEKEAPTAKRRESDQQQPMVLVRSLSNSSLNRNQTVDADITLQAFMNKMEKLVTTTLAQMRKENSETMSEVKAESGRVKTLANSTLKDIKTEGEKYMAEMKNENNKLSREVAALQRAVGNQEKAISGVKKDLKSVESDLTACFNDTKMTVQSQGTRIGDLEKKIDDIPELSTDIDERLKSLEKLTADMSTKMDNMTTDGETDLYPIKRSIVAMQVWIKPAESPQSIAEMIINEVLGLTEVGVIKAETVDEYDDGNCTIKILLDSAASVRKVMEAKAVLGTCNDQHIRSIWITRCKSHEQRMLERNCALLMREVDKEGKYRQNSQGRIVRVSNERPRGLEEPSNSVDSIPAVVSEAVQSASRWRQGNAGSMESGGADRPMRGGGPMRRRGGRGGGRGGHSKKNWYNKNQDKPNRVATESNSAPRGRQGLQVSNRALEALSKGYNRSSDEPEGFGNMDTTPAPGERGVN